VKTGSDTQRIYLEIIPQLPPGVFIHVHDITLPFSMIRMCSRTTGRAGTALLLALLIHNPHLAVMACESALHHDRTEALAKILSDTTAHAGGRLGARLETPCSKTISPTDLAANPVKP